MLHAASLFIGLWIIWLFAFDAWRSPIEAGAGALAALACVLFALRAGGASPAISRSPSALLLAGARVGAVAHGAFSTLRAALAADVTLRPALVRVKSRATDEAQRAEFGAMVSVTPGLAVVDIDSDGMLVHVNDEDGIDAVDLGRLEAQVIGRRGGGL